MPYVWGANEAGLLGLEASAPDAAAPLEVSGLPPLSHVVCTAYSTAFLASTGELLLLGGDPRVMRPRLAGLPGKIGAPPTPIPHLPTATPWGARGPFYTCRSERMSGSR